MLNATELAIAVVFVIALLVTSTLDVAFASISKISIRRLTLHGYLHLRGYDHETDSGEMRTLERLLRRRFAC